METQPYDADAVAASFASSGSKELRPDAVGESPRLLPGKVFPASRKAEVEREVESGAALPLKVQRGPPEPLLEVSLVHSGPEALPLEVHSGPEAVPLEVHTGPEAVPLEVLSGPKAVPLEVQSGPKAVPLEVHGGAKAAATVEVPVLEVPNGAVEAQSPWAVPIGATEAPAEASNGAGQKRPMQDPEEPNKKGKLEKTSMDPPPEISKPMELSSDACSPNSKPASPAQDAPAADAAASQQFSVMNFQAIRLHRIGECI